MTVSSYEDAMMKMLGDNHGQFGGTVVPGLQACTACTRYRILEVYSVRQEDRDPSHMESKDTDFA